MDKKTDVHTTHSNREDAVEQIRALRLAGNLADSIRVCTKAKDTWPKDSFFAKILADLYFQNENYKLAFLALTDYVALIGPSRRLVGDFAKRYYRFRRVLSSDEMGHYAELLRNSLDESGIDSSISNQIKEIILPDIKPVFNKELEERTKSFIKLLSDDSNFYEFVKAEKQLENEDGSNQLRDILNKNILNRARDLKTFRIDTFCVSIYERLNLLENAVKIATELVEIKQTSHNIMLLFRICRIKKDYSAADAILEKHRNLLHHRDFNILYEYVYYFESKNDFHMVQSILRAMDKSFSGNYPVLRTVRNFYIRFGMLDEAKRLDRTVFNKNESSGEKYSVQIAESEIAVASKMQDLYSQLEHQKQLAAISDLTTGISHELGQPITNIRYTIQYYRRVLANNSAIEQVNKVFDSILEETERMGGLIRRLAPLTSSRGIMEQFNIMERIARRVEGEEPRLKEGRIEVTMSPKKPILFTGDPVKFDQLISNLILNAIDAINEKKEGKNNSINISVENGSKDIKISFADTGIGIPIENKNKIFDPFFSTKAPGKGEGLGLFIVWNLLKMLEAKIYVDDKYKLGARFLITIPKQIEA